MEVISIFIFWGGILGMLFMLKRGLAQVEASLEKPTLKQKKTEPTVEFKKPDSVGDIIGEYMNSPIYCKITVGDEDYHFNRIEHSPRPIAQIHADEWLIAPGVVYSRMCKAA